MLEKKLVSREEQLLNSHTVERSLRDAMSGNFREKRVLVLIPDHTRSLPLHSLFRSLVAALRDTSKLDFLVALGTHPPLSKAEMNRLVGITAEERMGVFSDIDFYNHHFRSPDELITLGNLSAQEVGDIAGECWHPSLDQDLPVKVNKKILEYDHLIVLGPTFPHEVVGFSGGAKYFFPGISGPDIIHTTHWVGALCGVQNTIGVKDTPVRRMIHRASEFIPVPITLVALVVVGGGLKGLFIGDVRSAWKAAADLSSRQHIVRVDRQYQRVLSVAPPMYSELWTAAKAMYKVEDIVADGGELILYAPHLKTVSEAHGKILRQIGYHVLPFYLQQWVKYKDYPLGVLAHSTHLKGAGTFCAGKEQPRIEVALATGISEADCRDLNLGYWNPDTIELGEWKGQEQAGVRVVPRAGEVLYRFKG